MSVWLMQRIRGGRVAIRIQNAHDMPRRVLIDGADPSVWREEWRCHACNAWFERGALTMVASGRHVGDVPETWPYCAPCLRASALSGCGARG